MIIVIDCLRVLLLTLWQLVYVTLWLVLCCFIAQASLQLTFFGSGYITTIVCCIALDALCTVKHRISILYTVCVVALAMCVCASSSFSSSSSYSSSSSSSPSLFVFLHVSCSNDCTCVLSFSKGARAFLFLLPFLSLSIVVSMIYFCSFTLVCCFPSIHFCSFSLYGTCYCCFWFLPCCVAWWDSDSLSHSVHAHNLRVIIVSFFFCFCL